MNSFLLRALGRVRVRPRRRRATELVITDLLDRYHSLLNDRVRATSHDRTLFRTVHSCVSRHCTSTLAHRSITRTFCVSPGCLSRLFRGAKTVNFGRCLGRAQLRRTGALLGNCSLGMGRITRTYNFISDGCFYHLFHGGARHSPSRCHQRCRDRLARGPAAPRWSKFTTTRGTLYTPHSLPTTTRTKVHEYYVTRDNGIRVTQRQRTQCPWSARRRPPSKCPHPLGSSPFPTHPRFRY